MRAAKSLLLMGVLSVAAPALANAQAGIRWLEDPYQARQIAQAEQRLILLHFYTDWCGPCRQLDRDLFPQYEVMRSMANNYVPVKVNAERYKDFARYYRVDRWPTDVIVDPNGREVFRSPTPRDARQYVQILDGVAADYRSAMRSVAGAARGVAGRAQAAAPADQGLRSSYVASAGGGPYPPVYQDNRFAGAPAGAVGYANPYAQADPNAVGSAPRPSGYETVYGNRFAAPPASPGGASAGAVDPRGRSGSYAGGPPTSRPAPQEIHNRFASDPRTTVADADPPLALDGFCPVTLADREVWERGDVRWGAIHRGRTYLFASPESQQRFLADPDRFSPMLSGYDVVRYIERGDAVPGERRHGMWYQGKMYLFADESSLGQFNRSPDGYMRRTIEIMMASGR
jgi:protein disulfide-isomerase